MTSPYTALSNTEILGRGPSSSPQSEAYGKRRFLNVRKMRLFFPPQLRAFPWATKTMVGEGTRSILKFLSADVVIGPGTRRTAEQTRPLRASHGEHALPLPTRPRPASSLSLEVPRVTETPLHRGRTRFSKYLHKFPKTTQ